MGFVDDGERIEVPDAATWRAWLEDNHAARIAKIVAGAAEGRRP